MCAIIWVDRSWPPKLPEYFHQEQDGRFALAVWYTLPKEKREEVIDSNDDIFVPSCNFWELSPKIKTHHIEWLKVNNVLGIPRMPSHKAHAQTPAYQSVKKYEVQKIHLGPA